MSEQLAKALVAIQAEMPAITPDAVNPHFRNHYVSLDHLLAKALPVLNKHGVALIQLPSHNELGHPTLTTRLMHESGAFIEQSMPLFLPKNDPQGQGSAITYARRYAAAAALGISGERDDDGEAATHPGREPGTADSRSAAAQTTVGSQQAASRPGTTTDGFRFPTGKNAGKTLAEVGSSYLDWYLANGPREDVKAAILEHRGQPAPAAPLDEDIPFGRTGDGGF